MLINDAFAQGTTAAQADGGMLNLLLMFAMVVVFYFLLIRPQSKRAKEHKQTIEALQRGDEVITNGGILGLIINVSESYVIIEVAPAIEVTVLKTSVQTLLPKGTLKSIEPSKGGKTQKAKTAKAVSASESNMTEDTHEVSNSKDDETEKNSEKK